MIWGLALIGVGAVLLILSKKSKHRMKILIIALIITLIGIFLPMFV
ncbi:MAG: hypothetical protein JSW73_03660 [Candidatus Woesearchaeota archaeon]|nr:MAG: hypothetical protein JSW73_03660 [Candidatus Woesearchaeota archaeon]